MNYRQSLRYLNSFLNFERVAFPPDNRLWNLKRMRLLLDLFNHPEKALFPIIIAGTKGKGSTGFFLESILKESGHKAGFYTSPHLIDPRERIRIDGQPIHRSLWCSIIQQIQNKLKGIKTPHGCMTYFEIMTMMAILAFHKTGIGAAIFEVGMGGRLDATNAFDSKLAIFTPIHYDHEAILGNTLEAIAKEKAAVMRPRMPVVMGPELPDAKRTLLKQAQKIQAVIYRTKPLPNKIKIGLVGNFQRINAAAAVEAARVLRQKFHFNISEEAISCGLKNRNWPGRFETLQEKPRILIDAAHNPASANALVKTLENENPNADRILVFGGARDKKTGEILEILSRSFQSVILTRLPTTRSQDMGRLISESRSHFAAVYPVPDIGDAMKLAKRLSDSKTWIVATGSFYLIGEVKKRIHHA